MSRYFILIAFVTSCFVSVVIPRAAQAAEFRALGTFGDLSDNGHVVVKGSGWRSLPDGAWQEIPRAVPAGPWYWDPQRAYAVTADGSRVYLSCQVDEHYVVALRVDDIAPFVFENGIHTMLPRLHDEAYPLDATPTGSVVVGCDYEFECICLPSDSV